MMESRKCMQTRKNQKKFESQCEHFYHFFLVCLHNDWESEWSELWKISQLCHLKRWTSNKTCRSFVPYVVASLSTQDSGNSHAISPMSIKLEKLFHKNFELEIMLLREIARHKANLRCQLLMQTFNKLPLKEFLLSVSTLFSIHKNYESTLDWDFQFTLLLKWKWIFKTRVFFRNSYFR